MQVCLAALALAEPEADPALLYGRLGYGSYGSYSHGLASFSGYPAYGYGYSAYRPYGYYGKRSADAEPEAEADPALLYAGAHGAYSAYNYPRLGYAAATYPVYPSSYSAGYGVSNIANTVGITGLAPAALPALPGGYAGAGRYRANSAGVLHFAKRSADAEPEPEADPALLYAGAHGAYSAYNYPRLGYAGYSGYPYRSLYSYAYTPYGHYAY